MSFESEFFPALIIFAYVSSVFSFFFSLLVNWCQHWFEFFPNPPVNILGMVENVLVHHDKRLMQHFVSCHVTSQVRPRKASGYSYPQSGTQVPSHLIMIKLRAHSISYIPVRISGTFPRQMSGNSEKRATLPG